MHLQAIHIFTLFKNKTENIDSEVAEVFTEQIFIEPLLHARHSSRCFGIDP